MSARENTAVIVVLLYIVLIIGSLIGWVLNVIDLLQTIGGGFTTLFVLRVVGVFVAPLGAILGWVT